MKQQQIVATDPRGLVKDLDFEEPSQRPLSQEERSIEDLINSGEADLRDFEPTLSSEARQSPPTKYMERNPLEDTGMHIATLSELRSYGHVAKRKNY
ncbi:MAG: hypothetical protein AABX72_00085 [Nanoarchaeota archaeon]